MRQKIARHKLFSPTLVYNAGGLSRMLSHLRGQPLIALDTESDSLYSYYPKVCLIQITTYADPGVPDPGRVVDFLVDPLRLEKLGDLGRVLADPAVEVVMHAAENDILTLQRDFHFKFTHIFDTQLAARILGWQGVGLASILETQFGLINDKRMQRTNWGVRPLTPQQIAYAQMDTHYLPELRALQIQELKSRGRWEEAQEAFQQLSSVDFDGRTPNQRSFWQMKDIRSVPREHTGVLEALWEWREGEAQRQNRPPFKVAHDQVLVRLAAAQPGDRQTLYEVEGLSNYQIERYGKAIVAAIAEGKRRPLPSLPEPTLRPEQLLDKPTLARFDALRRWRTKVAQKRGVATDIIFNNSTLLEIARRAPQSIEEFRTIPEIGPWKAKTYASDMLALLTNGHTNGQG